METLSASVLLDRAVTRNARLIVVLRHLTYEMHEQGRAAFGGHVGNWMDCPHVTCGRVREAIAGQRSR